jgi:adenylate cyclase
MTVKKVKRKLTTIFCADVQSYSTLMAGDEADTLRRLQRYRAIMGDLFERHDGRKVNTWGDAVIAEFTSVVEAVRCGVEIQEAISAENRDLPPARQMWFRIGINLGDVMQDEDDLYGDGVNIASRLESLADPGGIMVSETVFDLTHKQLAFGYDFAGEQTIKGQDAPITGYRVRMRGRNADDAEDGAPARMAAEQKPASPRLADLQPSVPETRLGRFRAWFQGQPRSVRAAVSMIGVFFTINLVTDGLFNPWFIYPSIPFALFLVLRVRR